MPIADAGSAIEFGIVHDCRKIKSNQVIVVVHAHTFTAHQFALVDDQTKLVHTRVGSNLERFQSGHVDTKFVAKKTVKFSEQT